MEKTYKCEKCQGAVNDSDLFCIHCGSRFDSDIENGKFTQADFTKMATEIETALKKVAGDSALIVKDKGSLGLCVVISYTNGKDKSEYPNGIAMNDNGFFQAMISPEESSYKNGFKTPTKVTFQVFNRNYQIPKSIKVNSKTGDIEQVTKYAIDKLTYLITEVKKLGKSE